MTHFSSGNSIYDRLLQAANGRGALSRRRRGAWSRSHANVLSNRTDGRQWEMKGAGLSPMSIWSPCTETVLTDALNASTRGQEVHAGSINQKTESEVLPGLQLRGFAEQRLSCSKESCSQSHCKQSHTARHKRVAHVTWT